MPNQQTNLQQQFNQPSPSIIPCPKPKFNLKYILIILILAALVGGTILAYQYWWLPKQETRPPEITIQNQTANWQTYRNEEYGFEVKYPKELSLSEGSDLSRFNLPSKLLFDGPNLSGKFANNKNISVFFQIFNNEKSLSLQDYITSTEFNPELNPDYSDPKYRDLKETGWVYVKNDSIEIWSTGLRQTLGGFEVETYLMDVRNPKIVERSYFGINDGENKDFVNNQYKQFEQIISTFKFIK